MPRMIKILTAVALLALAFVVVPAYAEEPQAQAEQSQTEQLQTEEEGSSAKQAIALTDQQKQELAAIYRDMFDKKKQLIAKYLEFGVITQEKAAKWSSRLDAHYTMLEQNGFVPDWSKCKKKKEKRPE